MRFCSTAVLLAALAALVTPAPITLAADPEPGPQRIPDAQPEPEAVVESPAQQRARKVAQAHGLGAWEGVTEVAFTFNVEMPGRTVKRQWLWRPQDQIATLNPGTPETDTIDLADVTEAMQDTHAQFVNDTYWLLFPFQLVWSQPELALKQGIEAPFGLEAPAAVDQLSVMYPGDGGYTPGDRYDLYLEPAGQTILGWSYHKGAADVEPTGDGLMSNWAGPTDHGGVKIVEEFTGTDGRFRLFFTDVELK